MDISEIDDVRIDEGIVNKPVKFIIAQVSDGKQTKTILRSDGSDYHDEIAAKLEDEIAGRFKFDVKNGGRLLFDKENKKIVIGGFSSSYSKRGFPDYEKTKELLLKKYENFEIEIKGRMWLLPSKD